MLRLHHQASARQLRIIALGKLLVSHVLPRLRGLHVFGNVRRRIVASFGENQSDDYG